MNTIGTLEDELDTFEENEKNVGIWKGLELVECRDLAIVVCILSRVWVLSTQGPLTFVEHNTLYCFPQVVTTPLFINHMLIYLPSGDVVIFIKINIQEPFIISKV